MVTEQIFEAALGVRSPWYTDRMTFEPSERKLRIRVDFEVGSRFAVEGYVGVHPVHDTATKSYRHLNFFQHECELEVRVPQVKLPDGSVRQVVPPWAGKLGGFTLLFEASVLLLCRGAPLLRNQRARSHDAPGTDDDTRANRRRSATCATARSSPSLMSSRHRHLRVRRLPTSVGS